MPATRRRIAWIVLYGAASELGHSRIGFDGFAAGRRRGRAQSVEAALARSVSTDAGASCRRWTWFASFAVQSPPTLGQMRESLIALSSRIQGKMEERAQTA